MIYPEYIKGTSLHGYFNQMVAVNAFSSRFLFSNKDNKYKRRKSPVYISPFLTETYTAGLGSHLSDLIPEKVLTEIKDSAISTFGPFDPYNVATYDSLIDKELKYCPECIRNGEHYYYQQLKTEETCRKHGLKLVKGCPICGEKLKSTIEVTDLDAYICPKCFNRYADYSSPVNLVMKLCDIKEHAECPDNIISFKETVGHLAVLNGDADLFSDQKIIKIIKNYLDTGIRPDDAIIVKKGAEADFSLSELVIPYTEGNLTIRANRSVMAGFVAENERIEATPEQRACAYLVRKLLNGWNPRRLGIVPLNNITADIRRVLKDTGIDTDKSVIRVILEHYISDLYDESVKVFRDNPNDIFVLIAHENMIKEPCYAMMILEDTENYYIYLYR